MATNPATVEESAAKATGEIIGSLAILDSTYAVVTIRSPEDYQIHGDALLDIKRRSKAIEDKRKDIVTPLNEALKRINALFKAPAEILDRIAERISTGMASYQKAKEEEARKERGRLAALAAQEQARIRKEAERQATKAEKHGDDQAAALLRSSAETVMVPAPLVQAEIPKVAGLRTVETWRAEVFDLSALVMGVACGDVPATVLEPVQSVLNQAARMAKGQLNWPGVRAVCETQVVGTGR